MSFGLQKVICVLGSVKGVIVMVQDYAGFTDFINDCPQANGTMILQSQSNHLFGFAKKLPIMRLLHFACISL